MLTLFSIVTNFFFAIMKLQHTKVRSKSIQFNTFRQLHKIDGTSPNFIQSNKKCNQEQHASTEVCKYRLYAWIEYLLNLLYSIFPVPHFVPHSILSTDIFLHILPISIHIQHYKLYTFHIICTNQNFCSHIISYTNLTGSSKMYIPHIPLSTFFFFRSTFSNIRR